MSTESSELSPLDLPKGKEFTHRAHRFPGKFHPPLVKRILAENSTHSHIADPMGGSGTVGVESVANGLEVLSTDLDPLSCLMIRAKTNPILPSRLTELGEEILARGEPYPKPGTISEEEAREYLEEVLSKTRYIQPLNIFHWFDPYVAVGLGKVLAVTNRVLEGEEKKVCDAVHLAVSSSIRALSRADPQPVSGLEVTSVRREQLENGLTFDVEGRVRQAFNRLADGYQELLSCDELGESTVLQENAKNFDKVVDSLNFQPTLIITSPPYCNAIEYPRRHRLESEWLGLWDGTSLGELRSDRLSTSRDFFGGAQVLQETLQQIGEAPINDAEEICTKIETEKNQPRKANILRKYFLDSVDWLDSMYRALPTEGKFIMTIGPSTSYSYKIDTPSFLTEIARKHGFEKINEEKYTYKNTKMQYPTEGEKTEYEVLLEFEK